MGNDRILLIICGVIFSVGGLLLIISLTYRFYFFKRTRFWPTVKGNTQYSQVEVEDKGIDDNGHRILLHRPRIMYNYQVNKQEYRALESLYLLK